MSQSKRGESRAPKAGMNSIPSDVLQLITVRLNDNDLKKVSQTRLWDLLHPTTQNPMYWFMRVELLLGKRLQWDKYNASQKEWKRTFSELSIARPRGNTEFISDLITTDHCSPLSLRVSLDVGHFPSDVEFALAMVVHPRAEHLLEILLQDERVRLDKEAISSVFDIAVMTRSTTLPLLLEHVSSEDINRVLENGQAYNSYEVARLILTHPLARPTIQQFNVQLFHYGSREREVWFILRNKHFNMAETLPLLHFNPFFHLVRNCSPDQCDGYEFGVELTRNRQVMDGDSGALVGSRADDYDEFLRVLLVRDLTTQECIEYMRTKLDIPHMLRGFQLLLQPEMTLRKMQAELSCAGYTDFSAGLAIKLVCTHLGGVRSRLMCDEPWRPC